MRTATSVALVAASGLFTACREPTADPVRAGPLFSTALAAACPTPANVTVSDETSLRAALSSASPGEVIGLNGFFQVGADVIVTTPAITLTCATPGSGLRAQAGAGVFGMLSALANGVAVEHLVLDGSNAETPYYAADAAGVRLSDNSVTCGLGGECAFTGENTPGAVVADNQFVSNGSFSGVHMQLGIDGARVERNTIVATAPSTAFAFGGIRVRDGSDVVVADNVVQGPWSNSISPTNLANSHFENNQLDGAGVDGIRFTFFPAIAMTDNVFRNNRVAGAGSAGIFAQLACRNTFAGNNLNGNAGDMGLVFDATTGANTFVGNKNVVVDNGAFDCDGDGSADPNIITGPGKERRGVRLGPPAGDPLGNGRLQ